MGMQNQNCSSAANSNVDIFEMFQMMAYDWSQECQALFLFDLRRSSASMQRVRRMTMYQRRALFEMKQTDNLHSYKKTNLKLKGNTTDITVYMRNAFACEDPGVQSTMCGSTVFARHEIRHLNRVGAKPDKPRTTPGRSHVARMQVQGTHSNFNSPKLHTI